MVRDQLRTEGAGVTLLSCFHMFPGLHVDAHTCGDGLHPGAGSTPSQGYTDSLGRLTARGPLPKV